MCINVFFHLSAAMYIFYFAHRSSGKVLWRARLSVCLSVCQLACLRNHTRDHYQFLCACCLWPWLGSPLAGWQKVKIPRGRGNFGGCPGQSKPLTIFAAAIAAVFATEGIIQLPITSCSRRNHLVCPASANRIPENSKHRRCGLSVAGKGLSWWEFTARVKSDIYDWLAGSLTYVMMSFSEKDIDAGH